MYIVIRILNGYCKLLKDSFNQAWLTMAKQYDSWLRWPHAAANMRDHTQDSRWGKLHVQKKPVPLTGINYTGCFPGLCAAHIGFRWCRRTELTTQCEPTAWHSAHSSLRYGLITTLRFAKFRFIASSYHLMAQHNSQQCAGGNFLETSSLRFSPDIWWFCWWVGC